MLKYVTLQKLLYIVTVISPTYTDSLTPAEKKGHTYENLGS